MTVEVSAVAAAVEVIVTTAATTHEMSATAMVAEMSATVEAKVRVAAVIGESFSLEKWRGQRERERQKKLASGEAAWEGNGRERDERKSTSREVAA